MNIPGIDKILVERAEEVFNGTLEELLNKIFQESNSSGTVPPVIKQFQKQYHEEWVDPKILDKIKALSQAFHYLGLAGIHIGDRVGQFFKAEETEQMEASPAGERKVSQKKETTLEEKFDLGTFEMGLHKVRIKLIPGMWGGSFYMLSEEADCPLIEIGMEMPDEWEFMDTVFHELFELNAQMLACRYRPDEYKNNSADQFVFHFTHSQFCEILHRSTEVMYPACDKGIGIYREYQKSKSDKKS